MKSIKQLVDRLRGFSNQIRTEGGGRETFEDLLKELPEVFNSCKDRQAGKVLLDASKKYSEVSIRRMGNGDLRIKLKCEGLIQHEVTGSPDIDVINSVNRFYLSE